jgi:molybdenum-dependent DNA-binding transcriptional regulator ModE
MLWPAWSLRFALPDRGQRPIRPALSVLLLLVDTPLRLQEATELLSSPVNKHAVSRILQSLSNRSDWPATRTALGRLSDYLAEHNTPIDYQRRRQLDYTALLPDHEWKRICRDTGTPGRGPARARVVRLYLYERLSGLPADTGSTMPGDDLLRRKIADFPRHLTPELAGALESYCREFLAGNDVGDEPPFWSPPNAVFAGLRLPGPDPEAVEVAALHRLLRNAKHPMGQIGSRLGTTLDVVRYLSERNPAPARPPKTPGQSRAHGEALRQARAALSPAQFAQLYLAERKSLDDIGAHVGVGRSTVTCLAHEYGIPLRRAHRRPHPLVDRDWLHEQYVTQGRTLVDIAAECGMSSVAMCRQAKKHGIPVRSRGGRRGGVILVAKNVPPLLRPALTDSGGWKRLERFAAAAQFPTLMSARRQLGLGQLGGHVQRLETDLDTQLVIRGQPGGGAMQLTDAGQQVLAAVRKVQRNQNRRTGQKRQSRLNSPVAPPRARRSPLVPSGDARN